MSLDIEIGESGNPRVHVAPKTEQEGDRGRVASVQPGATPGPVRPLPVPLSLAVWFSRTEGPSTVLPRGG